MPNARYWLSVVPVLWVMATFAEDTEEAKRWHMDVEFGFKSSQGNTNETTLAFRNKLVFEESPWKNTLTLAADNTVSESERTEEKYYITEKLDRLFTQQTYGFVRGAYERDLFSGFDYQASYVVGFGHRFLNREDLKFSAEMGLGSIYERLEDDLHGDDELMIYFGDEFAWVFSGNAELGQQLSVEYSNVNTLTRASVFLKSRLIAQVSLRVSYGVKHNSLVAHDKQNTDRELLTTLLYSF